MVAKTVKHLIGLKILTFFANKTRFIFIMFMKHADSFSEHNKYQMKWVVLFFYPLCQKYIRHYDNYCNTPLWHSVNIFPENFNTNVNPCLLQLKQKAFLWMYNGSVQFIWGASPSFSTFQQIPSITGSSGNSYCNGQLKKTTEIS